MLQKHYAKANTLWMAYLTCSDVKQATGILMQWQKQMDIVHAIQDRIINLFTNDLQDDATQSYISQAVWLDQGVYQDRSDDCLA